MRSYGNARHRPSRFHVISEPSQSTGKSYDFVTVHGPGGDWDRSWTSGTGFNWISKSLNKSYPSCRILSYECPSMTYELARTDTDPDLHCLTADLVRERQQSDRNDSPVVFIAHGLGGILAKQLFVYTHPSRSKIAAHHRLHNSIQGFVFLGTPHQHYTPANFGDLRRTFEHKCERVFGGVDKDLANVFENASRINDEFFRFGGEDVSSICFYESEPIRVGLKEIYVTPKDIALFRSRAVDGGGLRGTHFTLAKYAGLEDQNFIKVIRAFENLMTIINDGSINREAIFDMDRRRGVKLLSLDGGGVKGLFSVLILRSILREAHRLEGSTGTPKRPHEYFDLIGGTSAGGFLAIMLGRLQMDIDTCVTTYRNLSIRLFQRHYWLPPVKKYFEAAMGKAWYSGDSLKDAICDTVNAHLSDHERESMNAANLRPQDIRLVSIEHQRTRCFVCAIREGKYDAQLIRSYRTQPLRGPDTTSYTIWQAARATSAAPTYFPAIDIEGAHYFDGGLSCNNPIVNVIDEARAEFPHLPISTVLSIGTGKSKVSDPHGSLKDIIDSLRKRATDTEMYHERVMTRREYDDIRSGYFRFQEDDELGAIDLAAADRLDEIAALAERYLAKEETKAMVMNCARRLVSR